MMMVRRLQATDEAEWLRLRQALWPDYDIAELKQEMTSIWAGQANQPVFVVDRPGDGLCGFVEVSIHTEAPGCTTDRIGYLEGWYVDSDWRGRGLGRQLVEVAEAWARSVGCREMASDTDPAYPASPAAHAALGYEETERYFRKDLE